MTRLRTGPPPIPHTVANLDGGDSVLILGRENHQTGDIEAFLLIAGFSASGALQPGPGLSPDWIFPAIGFGGADHES